MGNPVHPSPVAAVVGRAKEVGSIGRHGVIIADNSIHCGRSRGIDDEAHKGLSLWETCILRFPVIPIIRRVKDTVIANNGVQSSGDRGSKTRDKTTLDFGRSVFTSIQ